MLIANQLILGLPLSITVITDIGVDSENYCMVLKEVLLNIEAGPNVIEFKRKLHWLVAFTSLAYLSMAGEIPQHLVPQ